MIRVGFDHPFRPLAWMEGQDAHGILIERVRQILVNAGWPPTFHPYTLESIEPALAAGEIDLIAFKGILPQRATSLAFSRPVLRSGTALFLPLNARVGSADSMGSLEGHFVATPRRGPLAPLITANYPSVQLLLTASYEEALRMVARGEAQAAALNLHVGRQWVLDLHLPIALPRRPIMDVDMAIATRFELADSLLPAINKAILPFELLHYGHGPAQAV